MKVVIFIKEKMRILRVFPRRTSFTPDDDLVYVGEPQLLLPEVDEVHVSCTFTWDKSYAEHLKLAWSQYYPLVKLGGCAYDSPVDDFVPGRYIKRGVTFTSRGCNNHCDFCLVHEREGRLRIIKDFQRGNIIQDNNILQTGKAHISKVIEMLKHENAASFSGGIEADLVTDWFAEELRSIKIKNLFLACDTDYAITSLRKATKTLGLERDKLFCYTLIGRETIKQATDRLEAVWDAGCIPFAQLFQPADKWIDYSKEWKDLARTYSRPAAVKALHKNLVTV
jgi:hypothetical protein